MRTPTVPSLAARRDLQSLGQNLSIARRKRRMTQASLAERAGINVSTVRRLEKGHPGASLGALAMVLLVLGEKGRLGNLMDVAADPIGLAIGVEELPQRVRSQKRKIHTKTAPPDNEADPRPTNDYQVL